MKTDFLFLWILIVLLTACAYAQIGGLSGSKVSAYCVDVVGHHKIEFEPVFYHFTMNQMWNNEGRLSYMFSSPDSAMKETGVYYRLTYGLWDVLEFGAGISSDFALGNIGLRCKIMKKNKIGLAAIAGVNLPMGNEAVDISDCTHREPSSAGLGAVLSYQHNDNLSFDLNAQYQASLQNKKEKYFVNADAGYYLLNHRLQIITGIGCQGYLFDDSNIRVLTIYPGISIETGNNYILVFSTPFDVYGVNACKKYGINIGLTLIFT